MKTTIDLAEYAKGGKTPPKNSNYKFKVDKKTVETEFECRTGKQILELAEYDPSKFKLYQVIRGSGKELIPLDKEVCFTAPGIERFVTFPIDPTDGSDEDQSELRRVFKLPPEDVDYMNNEGLLWETFIDQNRNILLIHNFPVPLGYNHSNVKGAVLIPSTFGITGDGELDMIHFFPHLERLDKVSIPNLAPSHIIEGVQFQQWSRHRQWRGDQDSLTNHLAQAEFWLENEFTKRPRRHESA